MAPRDLSREFKDMLKNVNERGKEVWHAWKTNLMPRGDDELDGLCDPNLNPVELDDRELDGIVLFADIDSDDVEAIEQRIHEWQELFNAS
jgi:hypothetical protein